MWKTGQGHLGVSTWNSSDATLSPPLQELLIEPDPNVPVFVSGLFVAFGASR